MSFFYLNVGSRSLLISLRAFVQEEHGFLSQVSPTCRWLPLKATWLVLLYHCYTPRRLVRFTV